MLLTASFVAANDGWVSVPRPEKVVHQLEEDHSIWVVFSKSFGDERVLVRFPEDPTYRHRDGHFEAVATHLGVGEMALFARKKDPTQPSTSSRINDISYRDAEHGFWVRERHIDTSQYHYILRVVHPNQSAALFRQFADSLEIES